MVDCVAAEDGEVCELLLHLVAVSIVAHGWVPTGRTVLNGRIRKKRIDGLSAVAS
jgi:hypothetical protein